MSASLESGQPVLRTPLSCDRKRGRPRAISQIDLRALEVLIESNPHITLQEISREMAQHMGRNLALMTWSRALRQLGLRKINGRRAVSRTEKQSPQAASLPKPSLEDCTHLSSAFLTDREWEALQTIVETPIGRGRPPVHDRRVMWNAVFYMIRTGTPWRAMPANFPSHKAVFAFYTKVKESGQLSKAIEKLHLLWQDRSVSKSSSELLVRSA